MQVFPELLYCRDKCNLFLKIPFSFMNIHDLKDPSLQAKGVADTPMLSLHTPIKKSPGNPKVEEKARNSSFNIFIY